MWVEHGFEDVRQSLVVRGGAVKDEGVSDGEFGMKKVVTDEGSDKVLSPVKVIYGLRWWIRKEGIEDGMVYYLADGRKEREEGRWSL